MSEQRETWKSAWCIRRIAIEIEGISVEHRRVSPGEPTMRRGNQDRATDGDVGQENGFPVDRDTEHSISRVPHAGHLCGEKDVWIPVPEITQIDEDRVYLALNKKEVADLPTIPVRRWHEDVRGE
jgi:hypothetical protein